MTTLRRVYVPTNPLETSFSNPRTRQGYIRAPPIVKRSPRDYAGNPDVDKEIKNFLGDNYMAGSYRRRSKRTRRRRRGLKRKPIPRALAQNSKIVKCKAVKYLNFTNAGTCGMYPTQLNSIDDPFVVGGTGQPLGYDQWKALYRSAYVLGSKVILKAHNNGTVACMVGITASKPTQGSTSLASYEYYMETPSTKSRVLSQDVDHVTFSSKVSTKKFLSIKDIRDNEDHRIDLVNETAPNVSAFWHIWAQALDNAGTIDVDAVVTMEYIVLLVNPIIPSRSTET